MKKDIMFQRAARYFRGFVFALFCCCVPLSSVHGADLPSSACSGKYGDAVLAAKPGRRIDVFPVFPPECQRRDSAQCGATGQLFSRDVVVVHDVCSGWAYVVSNNKYLRRSAGWIDSKFLLPSSSVPVDELARQARATQAAMQKQPGYSPKGQEVCHVVADYATRGVLRRFRVQGDKWLEPEQVKAVFGKNTEAYSGGDYWRADLNGDGKPEHILIGAQGTAVISFSYVRSGKKIEEFSGEGSDFFLLKIGKGYYFVAEEAQPNGEELNELWRFGKRGSFQRVCAFRQRPQLVNHIMLGKHNPVCSSVASGHIRLLDFEELANGNANGEKSLARLAASSKMEPDLPGFFTLYHKAIKFDIDNDGRKENVTQAVYMSGHGRGCDMSLLVVEDDAGIVPASGLNTLLLGIESFCGGGVKPFYYNGVSYVDVQDKNGGRSVYRIKDNKVYVECKFERQVITEVGNFSKASH